MYILIICYCCKQYTWIINDAFLMQSIYIDLLCLGIPFLVSPCSIFQLFPRVAPSHRQCPIRQTKIDFSDLLLWRHNVRDGVSNHQPHDCLLNRSFRRRSKKTSKLRVTGLSAGNSPVTGKFPAQMASYAENVSIWWRHHDKREQRLHDSLNEAEWHIYASIN